MWLWLKQIRSTWFVLNHIAKCGAPVLVTEPQLVLRTGHQCLYTPVLQGL